MESLRLLSLLLIFSVLPIAEAEDKTQPDQVKPKENAADSVDPAKEERPSDQLEATHKQTSIIEPKHDGEAVQLNTFALDGSGNILACVSAPSRGKEKDSTKIIKGFVQTYSPEGKLVGETGLEFVPTAVNETSAGHIIVAGTGKVAKIDSNGKLLSVSTSPHIGDVETLTERISKEAKTQMDGVTMRYRDMVEQVAKRIKKIEDIPEEDRSKRDVALLKSLPAQKKMYEDQAARMTEMYSRIYSPEALLKRKMGITSVAVTSKDIFLTCYAIEGRGYEVWRTDHDFSAPKRIMTGLGGCCGQCDVQAAGDNLVIGENTKFKVTLVDRDGKHLNSFGERDRSSVNGFGSCCNPMNVRCCRNGDIVTSESSVGNIKRFSKDGELIGLIGKARISGGCKHVAVAIDEKRNRYYTMNIDQDHICVLLPLSEAPEYTREELVTKQAIDAHGIKLYGTWEADKGEASQKKQTREVSYSVKLPNGKIETRTRTVSLAANSQYNAEKYIFHSDGKMEVKGGMFEKYLNTWQASGHDKNTLALDHYRDGVNYYGFEVEFTGKDAALISVKRGKSVMSSQAYRRTSCGEECQKPTQSKSQSEEPVTTTGL